ncbi:hypothetical protein L596_001809 [Steinernema carpocapsae]|uniref:Saposin B-type domain-containing protein n=1 Tax=Steinernema carpocapsae TaxID=34508 RepID=A0A4U8UNC8_STECR|nr:hypothetical protein L596_001809 [Steinernema carpocapsae]
MSKLTVVILFVFLCGLVLSDPCFDCRFLVHAVKQSIKAQEDYRQTRKHITSLCRFVVHPNICQVIRSSLDVVYEKCQEQKPIRTICEEQGIC